MWCTAPWIWASFGPGWCSLPRQKSNLFDKAAVIIRKAKTEAEKMARPVVRQARKARGKEKKVVRMMLQARFQTRPAKRVRTAIVRLW
jgi:hypothetical protein